MANPNEAWFTSEKVTVEGFEPTDECDHKVVVIRAESKHLCTNCDAEFVLAEQPQEDPGPLTPEE